MASVVIYKYLGDKWNAKGLKHFGFAQLEILRNAMRFQGLKQNRRVVEFSSGINVTCTSVFGIDTVNIYVPPLLPVLKKDVIVVEEFCWCTTYFTEGEIVEVMDSTSEKLEGSYEDSLGSEYYYYNWLSSSYRYYEEQYIGKRYKVKVCRGRIKSILICHAVDFGNYTVGSKVILFCTGDYTPPSYSADTVSRKYPAPLVFSDTRCYSKLSNCFSCRAVLRPLEEWPELNDIDGTYVVTALSIINTPPPVVEGDITYKYVPLQELEKECVKFAEIADFESPDFPGESTDQWLYGVKGRKFFSVDFINKTVQLDIEAGLGKTIITAQVHLNTQPPFNYEDRMSTVIYSNPLTLKAGSEYTIIGYEKPTSVRFPSEVILFYIFKYSPYTGYETSLPIKLFGLKENQELECYEGRPGIYKTNEYKPVLIAKELVTETVGDIYEESSNTPIMDGSTQIGYQIVGKLKHTQKIVSATCYKVEEFKGIPVTQDVVNYEYAIVEDNDGLTYYNVSGVVNQYRHVSKRPTVYTIPEYLADFNLAEYDKSNNLPLVFEDYERIYHTDWHRTNPQYHIQGNGQILTVTKEGIESTTTITNHYLADESLLFIEKTTEETTYLSTGIAELYPGVFTYSNKIIFRYSLCAGLYNADFKIQIYDIYITKSWTLTKVVNPDYWGAEYFTVYNETISNVSYNCFIIKYTKDAPYDLSTFKIIDCDVIKSGNEIDWLKEKLKTWADEVGGGNPVGSNYYLQLFDAFAVPNTFVEPT